MHGPSSLDDRPSKRIVASMSSSLATGTPGSEDDPLVLRAIAGDRSAERELCARLMPAVRAFALRRLRASSVDDFAHDVFVLFVEALREGRIQDTSRAAPYALGICRNLARERARTNERRRELMDRYGLTEADLTAWEAPVMVRREHLEDCYSQLTNRARHVIRSTFCSDEIDSDIARSLSITEANVRIIRHRSLAALRSCLEKPISWVQP
jgi:RNA polymerase sigma factor (sigma-70 family)